MQENPDNELKSAQKKGRYGWPAMMRRATAAAYLELSVAAFEREIVAGTLPKPVRLGGKDAWSKRKLDEAIDILLGEGTADLDWRRHTKLYADQYR